MFQSQILLIGSTKRKLASFDNDEIKSIQKGPSTLEDLEQIKLQNLETLIISVRPDLNAFVSSLPHAKFFNNQSAAERFNIRGIYETLGSDRLANLLGGIFLYPESTIGVLDLGTCNTLTIAQWDSEKKHYQFRGGFISPGISASLNALSEKTTSLPLVSELDLIDYGMKRVDFEITNSTEESICEGIIQQTLAIFNSSEEILKKIDENYKFIITGGWSNIVHHQKRQALETQNYHIEPNLTLLGGNIYMRKVAVKSA